MEMPPPKRIFIEEVFFEKVCFVPTHNAGSWGYSRTDLSLSLSGIYTRRTWVTENNKKTDEAVIHCNSASRERKGLRQRITDDGPHLRSPP